MENVNKVFSFVKKSISILSFGLILFTGCSKSTGQKSVAVFVPGIIADSPIYAKMVDGVKEAAAEFNSTKTEENKVDVFIFEAGTNQAEWSSQLTALCAEGKYDCIFSSNPSLPELTEPLTKQFPKQKFILLDAMKEGNENITTVRYKQDEAAFISGFIAGLMSKSKKIGLITAQEYPVMNEIILPNFEKGSKAAGLTDSIDFRIVGNWYDAKKGAELADAMSASGVDVILPICGGASQGVVASAKEHNTMLCWFDSNSYSSAPGLVISCVASLQEKLSKEMALKYFDDKIEWGTFAELGMKDGYVKLVDDDPLYLQTVPEEIRKKVDEEISKICR